jgi:predicted ATPase/DNA-binding SARP family transcriptional activator
MELRLLGPIELRAGDRAVALGATKQRAVLAVLAVHLNEVLTSEQLIDAVWGEAAPATVAKSLQVYVSGLRKALREAGADGALLTRSGGYVLSLDPDAVDARRFERLIAEGRRALGAGDPAGAAERLRAGLALWRGTPLLEFSHERFAEGEIARLEALRTAALDARIDADLQNGHHAEVVAELERLVAAQPARERSAGQLMTALYRSERQAEALEVYQRTRRHLVDELGLEPGPELKALHGAILAQSLHERPQRVEPPAGHSPGVPVPATPTVGRADDLGRLRALLAEPATRLVTVVGPGGVGKTRLVTELGRASPNADFISLAAVTAAEHVASAIAQALDVRAAPDVTLEEVLARHFKPHERLLILDNFEHLLDAAGLVSSLLAAAPVLRVLTTSREPLRVRGERILALAPLRVNGNAARSPAVELFLQVARARQPGYAPSPVDLEAIGTVCRFLDGLPLAVELAAGRVGLLEPHDLAARLATGLDVLGRGPRDAPRRQQTLHATLSWSYDLLAPDERAAFAAMSVFAGGAELAVAEAITGASAELLEELLDKQLLVRAGARLSMLQTVRMFARQRLAANRDAEAQVAGRHAEHYTSVAERLADDLRCTGSREATATLVAEFENLRAAFDWALRTRAAEPALRLAAAVDEHLWLHEPAEGERWIEAALALEPAPALLRARAQRRRAIQLNQHASWEYAAATALAAFAVFDALDDARGRSECLLDLSYSRLGEQRRPEAAEVGERALDWARRCGDDAVLGAALTGRVVTAPTLKEAVEALDEAEALFSSHGNLQALAGTMNAIAHRALYAADFALAERALARSREAARDEWVLSHLEGTAGVLALFQHDHRRAAIAFREELRRASALGVDRMVYEGMVGAAAVQAADGDPALAARLSGAAEAFLAARLGRAERLEEALREHVDAALADAKARLGEQRWGNEHTVGTGLGADAAVELALSAPLPAR